MNYLTHFGFNSVYLIVSIWILAVAFNDLDKLNTIYRKIDFDMDLETSIKYIIII